ncbi:MAG: hypothetical protein K0V04_05600 [Deltaproteobacteria bacterium]|nr:hypothetical protein [Deltaproteobacteria bacterium]
MSRPILLIPGGGPVVLHGEIIRPGAAPLKVDLWRHVRYPPPELLHVTTIRAVEDRGPRFSAGDADGLIGKVVTWVWDCSALPPSEEGWQVRVDVQQAGQSTPGYPAEYDGPLPRRRPLSQLRIAEPVRALR